MGDEYLAIQVISSCTGWLGGLVLLVVGVAFVRAASARAGMLLAGAGGMKIVLNCCASAPEAYYRAAGYSEGMSTVFEATSTLAMLLQLAVYGLIAAAATALAKDTLARRVPGSP